MAKEKTKTELPTVMEGELQARLIKLREDAGFDVSQMANALCLSEDVITNLENEDFESLAEPPYVRGYLRNYAKLGDEDPSELINRYESLRGADVDELDFQIKSTNTISTTSKKRISPVWGQVIMLAVLLGGIALLYSIPAVNTWVTEKWQSFSSKLEPSSAVNNPSLLGELPVPAPLPEDEASSALQPDNTTTASNSSSNTAANKTNEATEATEATETTSENQTDSALTNTETTSGSAVTNSNVAKDNITNNTATTSTTNTATETPAAEAAASIPEEPVANALSEMINIKLVFNKEVWLRIKDKDNKTVFEGLNKAATEKTIELKKPLTFRVGNAQGMSLFIDSKAVDISSYINGSIANFTLE